MKKVTPLFLLLFLTFSSLLANQLTISDLKEQLSTQKGQERVSTLNAIVLNLIVEKQWKEAKEYANEALEIAKDNSDKAGLANAYDNIGLIYQSKYDYTNAMVNFVDALKIRNELNDVKAIALSKNNIGKVFFLQEDIKSALDNLNASLKTREEIIDVKGAAESYKNLGDVYLFKKMYGMAIEHYENAKNLYAEQENFEAASTIASKIGNIKSDLGHYDVAQVYYEQSLKMNSSIGDRKKVAEDYNNIAKTYIAQESFEEAFEANAEAYAIRKSGADKLALAETYKNFGRIYANNENKEKAEENLVQCVALLKEIGVEPGTQFLYKDVSDIYLSLGNYPEAYKYQVAYSSSRDRIFNKEKATALLELTTKYESEFEAEKQQQIISSLQQKESYSGKIRMFLLALLGLGAFSLWLMFRSNRQKKKDNELLMNKNEEIQRQKSEIDKKNLKLEENNSNLDLLNSRLVNEMAERESIEQSSFARERFLATMSHEMRTPINIIIGLAHLLMEEDPREDQIEHLRTLQFSGNNLVVFINDVLDFSKIEAGKLDIKSREFELIKTFEEIRQRFHLPAKDKGLSINYGFDSKLPNVLLGDPIRLNQVLTNLIGNAINYTDEGQIDVNVKLDKLDKNDATLIMTIKDTGRGITEEKLEKMFKKFDSQANDYFEGYESSGLGLAITKRLVELQHGKIEANSVVGEGTTFTVYLPYKVAKNTKVVVEEPKEVSYDHLAGEKVLVVEDNKINQLVVAKMLRKLNMEVITANDGLEALDAVEENYFDLILMDIQMPNMDGYRATAEIRKAIDIRKRDVPIIALTASAFLTEKEKAKLFGMNDHVGKPFAPEELLEKISSCLAVYKTEA